MPCAVWVLGERGGSFAAPRTVQNERIDRVWNLFLQPVWPQIESFGRCHLSFSCSWATALYTVFPRVQARGSPRDGKVSSGADPSAWRICLQRIALQLRQIRVWRFYCGRIFLSLWLIGSFLKRLFCRPVMRPWLHLPRLGLQGFFFACLFYFFFFLPFFSTWHCKPGLHFFKFLIPLTFLLFCILKRICFLKKATFASIVNYKAGAITCM